MGKSEWSRLDDDELDIVFEQSLDELVSDEIAANVIPCENAMFYILTGLALRTITISFFHLNYILPVIGVILSLLGFRKLKDENIWFRFDYILAWFRAIYFIAEIILNTMIIHSNEHLVNISIILAGIFVGVQFAELVCLWLGIRAVQKRAGIVPGAYSVGVLLVWYIILIFLSGIKYNGIVLMIAITVVYVLLLYTIGRLSCEFSEAGYLIRAGKIKFDDRTAAIFFAVVVVAGCVCGYVFGNSYHMHWKSLEYYDVAENNENISQIYSEDAMAHVDKTAEALIEQGFPDYVVHDLTDEEILACLGAYRILSKVKNDECGIQFTDVAVRVPDDNERWIIFHYYRWLSDKKFYGTEAVQVFTPYRDNPQGWASYGEIKGRVLYDKKDAAYTAPYHSLDIKTYSTYNQLHGQQTSTDIFGTFSFPNDGRNCRGYVAYSTIHNDKSDIFTGSIFYIHQRSWMQYPVMTAYESRISGYDRRPFTTILNNWFTYDISDSDEMQYR